MCPPGVDQTQRSPQQWQIVVPQTRQILHLPNNCWSESTSNRALFNHTVDLNWWVKLAKPLPRSLRLQPRRSLFNLEIDLNWRVKLAKLSPRSLRVQRAFHGEPDASAVQRTKLSRIESMPTELLNMVLSPGNLTKRDLIALSLASVVLSPHILHQTEQESAAP